MAVSLHRSNMLGMQNIMSRFGPYIGLRPRSQLGANRGLPRHLSYDCCDCDITAGQHICQSCIVSQYGMDAGYYGCTCSLCDFCDDAYAGGYSGGFSGRGGAYGGGCYYDPRMEYVPRQRTVPWYNSLGFNNVFGGRGGIMSRRRAFY